ncbi:MAG: hypothetical protein RLN76_01630 [Phycisphaeraceae bacterium]
MPDRILAACFGLVGFAAAAAIGMIAGNDPITIITRALIVMFACWFVGRACGAISMIGVREYLDQHNQNNPIPTDIDLEDISPNQDEEQTARPAL